jgi:hypothetical protein
MAQCEIGANVADLLASNEHGRHHVLLMVVVYDPQDIKPDRNPVALHQTSVPGPGPGGWSRAGPFVYP